MYTSSSCNFDVFYCKRLPRLQYPRPRCTLHSVIQQFQELAHGCDKAGGIIGMRHERKGPEVVLVQNKKVFMNQNWNSVGQDNGHGARELFTAAYSVNILCLI